ncbi:hypothetical protein VCHA53O466_140122 [Vibrio chagasii]|nr:hypothetical protein VCHA53O466_140122 [Vibrio chagasii]
MKQLMVEQKTEHLRTGQTVAARVRRTTIERLVTRRNHSKWLINGNLTYIKKGVKLSNKISDL